MPRLVAEIKVYGENSATVVFTGQKRARTSRLVSPDSTSCLRRLSSVSLSCVGRSELRRKRSVSSARLAWGFPHVTTALPERLSIKLFVFGFYVLLIL